MADLQGRELDVAIAKLLFGWKHFKFSSGLVLFLPPSTASEECIASRNPEEVKSGGENDAPPFSTSHNAVATVRAEIERRGLQTAFLDELCRPLFNDRWRDARYFPNDKFVWALLNASPEQQCRAALKAVEATK